LRGILPLDCIYKRSCPKNVQNSSQIVCEEAQPQLT